MNSCSRARLFAAEIPRVQPLVDLHHALVEALDRLATARASHAGQLAIEQLASELIQRSFTHPVGGVVHCTTRQSLPTSGGWESFGNPVVSPGVMTQLSDLPGETNPPPKLVAEASSCPDDASSNSVISPVTFTPVLLLFVSVACQANWIASPSVGSVPEWKTAESSCHPVTQSCCNVGCVGPASPVEPVSPDWVPGLKGAHPVLINIAPDAVAARKARRITSVSARE